MYRIYVSTIEYLKSLSQILALRKSVFLNSSIATGREGCSFIRDWNTDWMWTSTGRDQTV